MTCAIVSGGASGIGLACVERLAADGLAVASIDLAAAPAGSGAALSLVADVTDPDAVEAAVAQATELAPTVVVTAAGAYPRTTLADLTVERYRAVMDLNVLGTLLVAQAAARRMEHGAIVTIGSVDALTPIPNQLVYCASKAAVHAVTRSLALELAPRIRVVGVAPGNIDTPTLRRVTAAQPEWRERAIAAVPAGRLGLAEDIADVVAALASDAFRYVTGEIVNASGGAVMR